MYTHTPHSNEFVKENGVKRVSIMEFMQLCRLCLVKEQVNVSIFDEQGETRQICLKISSCLPVKVEKEDKLPKKICDGCLYKLDLLYQFYNTTATAEKQLLAWLEQANMDVVNDKTQPTVKQEKVEPAESTNENTEISPDAQTYIIQQQQLSYNADYAFKESQGSKSDNVNSEEPPTKRPRRRRQATKPIPPESLESSDNDNDNDNDIDNDNDAGDSMVEMAVTKTEEESESEGEENIDDPEPTKYEELGEDGEQPGPSGLGKGGADAPSVTFIKCENPTDSDPFPKEGHLQCLLCPKSFSRKSRLLRHQREVHCRLRHACDVCGKSYARARNLLAHRKAIHENDSDYKCEYCDKTFTTKADLVKHDVQVHTKKFKHRCDVCDRGFYSESAMKAHREGHVNPHACHHCGKAFKTKTYYQEHLLTHNADYVKKEYTCEVCSKVFESKRGYQRHVNSHETPAAQYLCDICGKAVTSAQSLSIHKRTHTGEKCYVCGTCGKRFVSAPRLYVHNRLAHTDLRYQCPHCGKAYKQKCSLDVHVRVHTGETPYACKFCDKSFKSISQLRYHSGKHGTPMK